MTSTEGAARQAARPMADPRAVRLRARTSITGCSIALISVGTLHFVSPTDQISALHRTISEYGLSTLTWAFNLGMIALALGSLAGCAALIMVRRSRLIRGRHCSWPAGSAGC